MWLKIWVSALEAVEGEVLDIILKSFVFKKILFDKVFFIKIAHICFEKDPWALAFDEEEEIHIQASAA